MCMDRENAVKRLKNICHFFINILNVYVLNSIYIYWKPLFSNTTS